MHYFKRQKLFRIIGLHCINPSWVTGIYVTKPILSDVNANQSVLKCRFILAVRRKLDLQSIRNSAQSLNSQESPVVRGEPGMEGVVGHLHPGSSN